MQRRQWTGSETFCRVQLHNYLKCGTQTLTSGTHAHLHKHYSACNISFCASVCHIIKSKNSELSIKTCRVNVTLESPCSWPANFAPQSQFQACPPNETSRLYFRVLIEKLLEGYPWLPQLDLWPLINLMRAVPWGQWSTLNQRRPYTVFSLNWVDDSSSALVSQYK